METDPCITLIRSYIERLNVEAIFTSRDLLCFGSRSSVDNAVYTLHQNGELVRPARGVFVRPERTKPVTELEIATTKARSFGREIISHPATIAKSAGLEADGEFEHSYSTNGNTSSFCFGSIVIKFKHCTMRNMGLGDNPVGNAIRTFCFLGRDRFSVQAVELLTAKLNPIERARVGALCGSMPSWLSNFFRFWYDQAADCGPLDRARKDTKLAADRASNFNGGIVSENVVSLPERNGYRCLIPIERNFQHSQPQAIYQPVAFTYLQKRQI